MEILEKIFLCFFQASLSASIVAILVIAILKISNNHICVRVKNMLWLLVLIKLLIPVIPETQINLFSLMYEKYQITLQSQDESNNLQQGKQIYTESKEKNVDGIYNQNIEINGKDNMQEINKQNLILWVLKIASCIWVIGVLILITTFILFIFNFKRKVKHLENHEYPQIQALMEECIHRANINSSIPIFIYDGFKSPCILGVIKPKIYIPQYVLRTSDYNQLSHIFLHELMHYKRKDLVYNFLGIIALSIHWFNPIVWFAINKMKIYREYACDACVLEILGEQETIKYGMTLINFSKMFSNNTAYSRLAIFFETNNQIKGRIEMIKQFKKGSYKISATAALCCLIATTVVLTNGVTVRALDSNNITLTASTNTVVNAKDESKFLIDAPLKVYEDMEKVEKVAGLKFKVPDFIPEGCNVGGFNLLKLSDKDNSLEIFFNSKDKKGNGFSFLVSEKDPIDAIKKSEGEIKGSFFQDAKLETKEESMKLEGIDGSNVTLTATTSSREIEDGVYTQAYTEINKYFIWENEGLWYSINYNSIIKNSENKSKQWYDLPQEDIGKIAKSIKYPAEVKSVSYSVPEREVSTEIGVMDIYDKEDLEKAKNLLGFNPKLPLKINEDIKINGASVGISGDSDIKNNKINYEVNNFYYYKGSSITFTQRKTSRYYDDIKKNGYFIQENTEDNKPKQIKAEKLNINNNEVFKYDSHSLTYAWKENGIYCSVTFFGETNNSDEIIKEFVNSKPID